MAKIEVSTVAPGKDDLPFRPFAHLWLSEYSKNSEGKILLSPELMTPKEIDESVDWLIKQLEVARKKAKENLRKTNKLTITSPLP